VGSQVHRHGDFPFNIAIVSLRLLLLLLLLHIMLLVRLGEREM
jgi:hypothetical protein